MRRTTNAERARLKQAGFYWGLCYNDEGDGTSGCLRHGWIGETMNIDRPWRCDYLMPASACLACLGMESIEEALEYC